MWFLSVWGSVPVWSHVTGHWSEDGGGGERKDAGVLLQIQVRQYLALHSCIFGIFFFLLKSSESRWFISSNGQTRTGATEWTH